MWLQPKGDDRRWIKRSYDLYVSGKHTIQELSLRSKRSSHTIRRHFDNQLLPVSTISISVTPVPLVFDATFFGRGYGLLIYRANGRNIYWREIDSEKIAYIEDDLLHLRTQGWLFSSFTIDGRRGVFQRLEHLFPETPVQMCHFHQKQIIQRYTTTKPKTECGKQIRKLMKVLATLSQEEFVSCLNTIRENFTDFLKERNENNQFRHRRLRSALRSLKANAKYLFTYKNKPELNIPNTTNSCDGSFAHWKAKVKLHRGLRKDRRKKMIEYLLSQS